MYDIITCDMVYVVYMDHNICMHELSIVTAIRDVGNIYIVYNTVYRPFVKIY